MPRLTKIHATGWLNSLAARMCDAFQIHQNDVHGLNGIPPYSYEALLLPFVTGGECGGARRAFDRLVSRPYFGDSLAPGSYLLPRAASRYYSIVSDKHAAGYLPQIKKNTLRYIVSFLADQIRRLNEKPGIHPLTLTEAGEHAALCLFAYNILKKRQLLALGARWIRIGINYTSIFNSFDQIQPMSRDIPSERTRRIMRELGGSLYLAASEMDAVTLKALTSRGDIAAMGLRAACVSGLISGARKSLDAPVAGLAKLFKHHGTALMFTADAHLAGRSPSKLIWMKAACEALRSMLDICRAYPFETSAIKMLDTAEIIALNLLPSAIRDGYVAEAQRVNQISCLFDARASYSLPGGAAQYRRITVESEAAADIASALLHLASNSWLCGENAVIMNFPFASIEIEKEIEKDIVKETEKDIVKETEPGKEKEAEAAGDNGEDAGAEAEPMPETRAVSGSGESAVIARIDIDTNYPYDENVTLRVGANAPVSFTLFIRVPGFAGDARIILPDGELIQCQPSSYARITRVWNNGDKVEVAYSSMNPRVVRMNASSVALFAGHNLLCLKLPETKLPGADGESADYNTEAEWAYALSGRAKIERKSGLTFTTEAYPVTNWGERHTIAAHPPNLTTVRDNHAEPVELAPYAETVLRIAQFPTL